jgi:hypothetical protein
LAKSNLSEINSGSLNLFIPIILYRFGFRLFLNDYKSMYKKKAQTSPIKTALFLGVAHLSFATNANAN